MELYGDPPARLQNSVDLIEASSHHCRVGSHIFALLAAHHCVLCGPSQNAKPCFPQEVQLCIRKVVAKRGIHEHIVDRIVGDEDRRE